MAKNNSNTAHVGYSQAQQENFIEDRTTPITQIETNIAMTITEARLVFLYDHDDRFYDDASFMKMENEKFGRFSAKGYVPKTMLNTGAFYKLTGEWHEEKKGRVFYFSEIRSELPDDKQMSLNFLMYKGFCPHLPKKTAAAIVDYLGNNALGQIEENPDCLRGIPGVGATWCERIPAAIKESRDAEKVFNELYSCGIRPQSIFKLYSNYKNETIARVFSDPYRTAEENDDAYPFTVADCIAWNHNLSPYAPFRISAGIREVLHEAASEGHTYLSEYEVQVQTSVLLSRKPDQAIGDIDVDRHQIASAVIDQLPIMAEEGKIVLTTRGRSQAVYLKKYYDAEVEVATRLKEIAFYVPPEGTLPPSMDDNMTIPYSPEQLAAIEGAMTHQFSVITGGPGTGKTTVMSEIVRRFRLDGKRVFLAAPTAKAADRMSEVTGFEARTIQRMLGYRPYDGPTFNLDHPLSANVVIIDEFSMVDILLMKDLVDAITPGTCLIAIGDVDQLPSVGAGNVLDDMMKANIFPVYRLSFIFRQGGGSSIPANAHAINTGNMPDFQYDFRALWLNPDDICDALVETVTKSIPEFFFRRPEEIRVLTPLREGDSGAIRYSRVLRDVLNPRRSDHSGEYLGFRIGDRVMQNVNSYKLGAMNGDEGIVESVDEEEKAIYVRFSHERLVKYTRTDISDCKLEISYAITVHKSQGSEYPVVLLVLPPDCTSMVSRRLLYTAVTRAKEAVLIMGNRASLSQGIGTYGTIERNSGLPELLMADNEKYGINSPHTMNGRNNNQLSLFDGFDTPDSNNKNDIPF